MNARFIIPMMALGISAALAGERETFDFGWSFKYYGIGTPEDVVQPIAADGCEKGHPAACAADGNFHTRWCALNARPGHFLRVTPDPRKAVSLINIQWESANTFDVIVILHSTTGEMVRKEIKNKTDFTQIKVDAMKISFFEIKVLGTDAKHWASIREISMFDKRGSKVALAAPQTVDAPAQPGFPTADYREVQLPHDWAIESPFLREEPNETGKLPWNGTGWYRKNFEVPADFDAAKDRYYLDFDGVMSCPKVYVNGQLAGEWAYGYASFRVDITPYLKAGQENLVAVVASNKALSTRWYPGAGIYRHVWLEKTTPAHIAHWGVYVTTPEISEEAATVQVKTTVENTGDKPVTLTVRQKVEAAEAEPVQVLLAAGESKEITQQLRLETPRLWSCESPHLYTLHTEIHNGEAVVDTKDSSFGVRTAQWKPDGFYLNGKQVTLNGVCEHHDLGPLGSAFHARAYERKIEKLKAMGCNSIRMTHNPPAPEVLDLCDKHGILVIDELFDIWKHQKYDKVNGYHRFWPEWWKKDVRNFVLRDRNHPSIIAWSGGNEIAEIATADGPAICAGLREEFKKYDTTRPFTVGVNDVAGARNGFGDETDVFGYNYKPWEYKGYAKDRPDMPFYASETASCVATRDTYFFPLDPKWEVEGGDDGHGGKKPFKLSQVSSYGIFAPGWGCCPDIEFSAQDGCPQVAGEYVWTGFDYIGEPTPYNQDRSNLANMHGLSPKQAAEQMKLLEKMGAHSPSRSSYFGIIDLAGFPKDNFYLYQSRWKPELRQAHILPHWNWAGREGEVTPVMAYSAGDEAELFVNGKSQGVRRKGEGGFFCQARGHVSIPKGSYRFVWEDVKYEPGEVTVVVKKDGKPWATARRVTVGPVVAVRAEVDRRSIVGDGRDLAFIELALVDAKGGVSPTDCREVGFSIEGPAELVGFCNGNQIDHHCMQDPAQEFFNGRILAVVRAKRGESGTAKVTIKAKDLPLITEEIDITPASPEQLKK